MAIYNVCGWGFLIDGGSVGGRVFTTGIAGELGPCG